MANEKNDFVGFGIPMFAWAIRVIGGGGGLAEMETLSLLTKLSMLVEPCRMAPALCGLTGSESGLLNLIVSGKLADTSETKLEFGPRGATEGTVVYDVKQPNRLNISSNSLYYRDGEPKEANELAKIIFKAWLNRPSAARIWTASGYTEQILESLAYKAFLRWKFEEKTLEMEHGRLRAINLLDERNSVAAFAFLERKTTTQDISKKLAEVLNCNGGSTQLIRIQNLALDGSAVTARVEWKCGAEVYGGHLAIAGLNSTFDMSVTLAAKRWLRTDCEGELNF